MTAPSLPFAPPTEGVTDMPASPDATLHRRRQGSMIGWPACVPVHKHPCDRDREGFCETSCVCRCDCDLPKWFEYSALWAHNRGAQLCDSPHCFGGIRR